jgi:hypothetical protein
MEKKSGRTILQQNIKEENENIEKQEKKENYKSHKNIKIKLDLFDKSKLDLLKQNLFRNLKLKKKIKINPSTIDLSPKHRKEMFLTIVSHPDIKSQNLTINYTKPIISKYENFVNNAIERIKFQKKKDLSKVIKKRLEINKNKKDFVTLLYHKNRNERNPSQNVLSDIFSELNKISIHEKKKRNINASSESILFPPINYKKSLDKPIKVKNFSNFNIRKNVTIDLNEQISSSILTEQNHHRHRIYFHNNIINQKFNSDSMI